MPRGAAAEAAASVSADTVLSYYEQMFTTRRAERVYRWCNFSYLPEKKIADFKMFMLYLIRDINNEMAVSRCKTCADFAARTAITHKYLFKRTGRSCYMKEAWCECGSGGDDGDGVDERNTNRFIKQLRVIFSKKAFVVFETLRHRDAKTSMKRLSRLLNTIVAMNYEKEKQ